MSIQSGPAVPSTVVMVDDDIVALALLEEVVSGIPGVEIITFEDPVEALEYCQVASPDLIISDYQMSGLDGLELLTRLRAEASLASVPIMIVTAMADREVRQRALELGANEFLSKPLDAAEIVARIRNMILVRQSQQTLEVRAQELAFQVRLGLAAMAERERELVMRLSRAAEFRDWESGAHVTRMAHYCRTIAERMELPRPEQDLLFLAAPMHDVGKIGIPDHILLKACRLDEDEFAIMKQHTTIGHQILADSKSELLQLAATIAHTHHERFDGQGYPRGLSGEAIPLASRILSLADVFDALMSQRPYKAAWTLDAALSTMRKGRDSQFDPQCFDAFLDSLEQIEATRLSLPDEPAGQASRVLATV